MKHMNQELFNSCAYLLAGFYIDSTYRLNESEVSFDRGLRLLADEYSRNFPGDDFAEQWEQVCKVLDRMLSHDIPDQRDRKAALYAAYRLALKVRPDGSKRKKLLGIFGGTFSTRVILNLRVDHQSA